MFNIKLYRALKTIVFFTVFTLLYALLLRRDGECKNNGVLKLTTLKISKREILRFQIKTCANNIY